ncbi:MAG: DNA translocase FtsK 4TM domain-containing protein [Flavobacteriaceae bacterium]|nr:DNA translocase FtsK 4TM domain-containing protein [Flavobacteriaceae bacterium]
MADFSDKSVEVENTLGKAGANLSDFFVYDGFGLATFIFPILLFFTGLNINSQYPCKTIEKILDPWNSCHDLDILGPCFSLFPK